MEELIPIIDDEGSTTYEAGQSSRKNDNPGDFIRKEQEVNRATRNNGLNIFMMNIDCIFREERKTIIDRWIKAIQIQIYMEKELFKTASSVLLLLDLKSEGIINKFIKRTTWNLNSTGEEFLGLFSSALYTFFLGKNFLEGGISNEVLKLQNEARMKLTKLQICDICELDNFNCEYEKYFYELSGGEYQTYVEMYLRKIPIVGKEAEERYNAEKDQSEFDKSSLTYAMELVRDLVSRKCEVHYEAKKLKKFRYKCCNKFVEPTQFGCTKEYSKKRETRRYKKPKYLKFKRKKFFKPGKYFKPKDSESQKNKTENQSSVRKEKRIVDVGSAIQKGIMPMSVPTRHNILRR